MASVVKTLDRVAVVVDSAAARFAGGRAQPADWRRVGLSYRMEERADTTFDGGLYRR